MKTTWLLGVALAFSGLAGAQNIDNWMQQKLGRSTPKGSPINPAPIAKEEWVSNHIDVSLKGKLGHYTPTEEARLEDYRSSVAARVDPTQFTAPKAHVDQHYMGKLGRLPGR